MCLYKTKDVLLFTAIAAIFSTHSYSQVKNTIPAGEKGFFPVYNYSTKTYKAAPQNWAIQQDNRGILYIGNNEGILEYDGVSWRLIKVSNETNVRSLVMNEKGRIFAGASGEIGFLEPDSSGNMKYRSLCAYMDKKNLDFSDVWSAVSAKDGIYFQSDDKIFRWDGKKIKVWNAEKSFHRIFNVNGRVFVRQREIGLMEMYQDKLVPIKGGDVFAKESIYGMMPMTDHSSDILICTKTKGLYALNLLTTSIMPSEATSFKLENFSTQIDPFLTENMSSYHLLKTNSLYSVATLTHGAAVINRDGDIEGMLNKQMGIQDETVYSQFADASGNLWLATSNGLSRTTIHSPITFFSDKNGLNGTVQDVARHNKILFAATNQGVYMLHPGFISNGSTYFPASFEKLSSIKDECWDLLSFQSGTYSVLLVGSGENIFSIDHQLNIQEVIKCKPRKMYVSGFDSLRVFIGLENGMASIYRDGNRWIEEAIISEIKESIYSIAEDEKGNLWMGHTNGVIKISFKNHDHKPRMDINKNSYILSRYDNQSGLPEESSVKIENINGHILFGTSNGIYNFSGNTFVPSSSIKSSFSGVVRQIHRIAYNHHSQTVWLETHLPDQYKFEFGYLKKNKDKMYVWHAAPFLPYSNEIIQSVFHDENGITWFGGSEGLFRYDSKADTNERKPYHAIIRKITIGKDSAIFHGSFYDSANISSIVQNQSLRFILPFSNNSIIFEFSSLDFTNEDAEQYHYFLEGFDKEWSNWKHETKAIYTNLPEGNYTFHVKSKNIFSQESIEAAYEFTILPPWYRTWWAYICYLVLSIGFVWGVVTMSTRGLKAIIRERTAEIVQQKEVIEYKNRSITDSINYAKRIQEAILPSQELMYNKFPESFILYRPKDIVAGDFYWFAEKDGKFIVAACDCTGHGVPGAFMSLISYSLLNEVLLDKNFTNPAAALDAIKQGIIKSLGQTGQEGEQKDGMDMALISMEVILDDKKVHNKLSFAGANNPLYLFRKGELIELNADKMPIGIYIGSEKNFTNKEIFLESGDTFYLFSDGFADQFGGSKGKKFTKKRYKDMLLSMQQEPMHRQKVILENTLDEWLGPLQQVDDILVMGIRVS